MAKRSRRNQPAHRDQGAQPRGANSIQRIESHESFVGPIPPPAILQQYDQLIPGAGNRLIKMAEDEAAHRRDVESRALESDIQERAKARVEARIGQLCGLAIGLAALGCGTYAAVHGAQLFGGVIGTGGVATLVAIFVYGRTRKPMAGA